MLIMKLLVIGGGLTALASSASAQVTCSTYGNVTQCNGGGGIRNMEITPVDQTAILGKPFDYAESERQQAQMREAQGRASLIQRQNQLARLHQAVGNLVALGRCDDATKLALRGGDFDLAERAKALCGK